MTAQVTDLEALAQRVREAPESAEAHEQLGLAQRALGRNDDAAVSFVRACERDAGSHTAWFRLGRTLRDLGRRDEAAHAFERAASAAPRFVDAFSCLSNVQRELGHFERAVLSARRALRVRIDYGEAHLNEGAAYHAQDKLVDAAISYVLALPSQAAARHNLDVALRRLPADAEPALAAALALAAKPDDLPALRSLATALMARKRPLSAAACIARIAAIDPHVNVQLALAEALVEGEAWRQADQAVRAVLGRDDRIEAHLLGARVGAVLRQHDRIDLHMARIRADKWDDARCLSELGAVFQGRGHAVRAKPLFERACELEPAVSSHIMNLATSLQDLGDHEASRKAYRAARDMAKNRRPAWSNLLFGMNCDGSLTPEEVFAEHVAFGTTFAPASIAAFTPEPALGHARPLRIGYVSPDFRSHAVAFYIEPVLRHHDKSRFEVFCYSDGQPDDVTARIRGHATCFRDVRGVSDPDLVQQIRADRIDILVDLAGHTARNRLLAFAARAAPVQASWIGYFGTTGVQTMDYRIADAASIPPELEHLFVEQVIRLPRTANCYAPPEVSPDVAEAPCMHRGHVTFGCFNHPRKLSRELVATFAAILHRVPGSRLVLKYSAFEDPGMRAHVTSRFLAEGVEATRIDMRGATPHYHYLESFSTVDISLDPFPYGGETTTLNSLWMGVPIVTLEGRSLAQRLGSRVARIAGLHEWVASSRSEYVDIAVRAAHQPSELGAVRPRIRAMLAGSAMLDHAGVTRELEQAYQAMWHAHANRELPRQAS